ncbi:MAG: hypothetical protein AAF447_18950 [Myxococcota bacterium]
MSDGKPPGDRPPERLTLRAAEDDPERRSAENQRATAEALRLGRQRSEAAETLWVSGHGAEALALARRALETTLEGASSVDRRSRGVSLPPPPPGQEAWTQLLRKRLRPGELEALHAVRAELRAAPVRDGDVNASHARLFRRTQRIRDAVDRGLTPLARSATSLRNARVLRLAMGGVIGLAVLAAIVVALLQPATLEDSVEASGAYQGDPRYAGLKAFDGDPNTEWQLDDRQRGWVERRFADALPMGRITIHNGHNGHWMDRGVRGYRVELYDAQDREVHRLRASFPRIEEDPRPKVHVLPTELPPIGRLRLVVESYFELGSSLAEVRWDPPGNAAGPPHAGDGNARAAPDAPPEADPAPESEGDAEPAEGEPGDAAAQPSTLAPGDASPSRPEEGQARAPENPEIPE